MSMAIPKKWLKIADDVAKFYARDFAMNTQYHGPNFEPEAVGRIACKSLYLSMTPKAYEKYGTLLEDRVYRLAVELFKEISGDAE